MREFKIIAAMADLHIGNKNISATSLKKQLKDHFFKPLEDMRYLDGIFICGDVLHSAISMASEYSNVFFWFVNRIYRVAKKKGATVIIIRGTLSHDQTQLDTIKPILKNAQEDGVDFRIYDTVEEITIWDNYKVLVLPDVKVKELKDIKKYLKEENKYDIILGHGTIAQMQFFTQESENMPTKTYIYDVDELAYAAKGPVLFGHIHQYQCIRGQFYYIGPFSMMERGNVDAGWVVCGIYDKDRTKFKVEHYINPNSASYYEIDITKKILDTIAIDDIVVAIDDIANEAKDNDLITLRITRGDSTDSTEKVAILENRYRKDRRFSIIKKIKNKCQEEYDKVQSERKDKYSYLMDSNMELPSILYMYYTTDVLPTIADKKSVAAILTEDDFRNALSSTKVTN